MRICLRASLWYIFIGTYFLSFYFPLLCSFPLMGVEWHCFIFFLCQRYCSLGSHLVNLRPLTPKFRRRKDFIFVSLPKKPVKTAFQYFPIRKKFQGKSGFLPMLPSLEPYFPLELGLLISLYFFSSLMILKLYSNKTVCFQQEGFPL